MSSRAIAAVALAVIVAGAGCASVPSSGSVRVGRVVQPAVGGDGDAQIQVLPPELVPGEAPGVLVRGFLRNLLSDANNYGAARAYLTPGTSWNARAGITTYDDDGLTVRRISEHTVQVSAPRTGTIDARGDFLPATGTVQRRFGVVKRAGQWRISALAAGTLLSTSDVEQALRPATVYYLNSSQKQLVPEQLLVSADQPGLATTLIRALLSGPSAALAAAAHTAVPHGTTLVGNVPVDSNGVAEVSLSGPVRQLSATELAQLSAQIVWTLRQLPDVAAVRLFDGGSPLDVPGVGRQQPVTAWAGFDPDAATAQAGALFVRNRTVRASGEAPPVAFLGRHAAGPAMSADGSVVAGLQRGRHGQRLLVGPTDGPLRQWWTARAMAPPVFLTDHSLLVSGRDQRGRTTVEEVSRGRHQRVAVPAWVPAGSIQAMAVSPDGSRVAMVTGTPGAGSLSVGVLGQRRDAPAIERVVRLLPAARAVAGVAWAADDGIVVTATGAAGRREVLRTDPTGYAVDAVAGLGLPRGADQVAASPGKPIIVAAGRGLWTESANRWVRLSTGHDPAYAG